MQVLFVTHNQHKFQEVSSMLPHNIKLLSLADINFKKEIEETGATLEENSLLKANVFTNHNFDVIIAEDTGLEVACLGNAPGVRTARYANDNATNEQNIAHLLLNMEHCTDRSAKFRTIFTLILKDKEPIQFEGVLNGIIALNKSGNGGFGYDPIFIPIGYNSTFAELSPETKNKISHRGMALSKVIDFLNKEN